MISIPLISKTQKLFFALTVLISLIGSLTMDITTIASRTLWAFLVIQVVVNTIILLVVTETTLKLISNMRYLL